MRACARGTRLQRRTVSFKLFYYDDRTPVDYQPNYFSDSTHAYYPFFEAPPLKVNVGSVSSVRARTEPGC